MTARSSLLTALFALAAVPAQADDTLARGKYLASIMDCGGCHTRGAMVGKPDPAFAFAGSDIGFEVPGLGYFYPPNLTPDAETGLGKWSETDIIAAVRKGVRPDGRELMVMPWRAYAALNDADARALAAYLKSLAPIKSPTPPMTAHTAKAPAPYFTVKMPQ
ncbi:MAG TPA: cytochrome c [Alphaproteobacteria bacterium]|nr:cytochrome c [Alphaproteobacteria bacterium]